MIKLENIYCRYEDNILENINLNIEKEITFIIGKNGSGKSTLASVLSGLKKPYKGNIIIDNTLITKNTSIKDIRSKIGMVFQNPSNQIVFSRVYDDIKFTLDNMNTDKSLIDNIIINSLKEVSVEDFKEANPYNLSLGQKQRITIASQLALKPDYIIFDEATSMLDINGKKDIYELITKLKNEGIGVIFITNIMDELIYADKVLILDNKKIYNYSKEEILSDLEILKRHKLDIPFSLKIINLLRKKGINTINEDLIIKELENL